jgi:addiction module RelE/StbE family toxin
MTSAAYRIIITPQAQHDLDGHFEYIFQRNPQGAQNVYNAIIGRIRKLRDFPLASRQGEIPGTREVFTGKYTYRIVFEIIGQEIYIVHIKHRAQAWPPMETDDDED